jgi:hypothetical protein
MKRQERPVQKAGIDLPKRAVYCFVTKARNRDKSMVSGDLEEEKQPFFTRLPSCWLRSPKFADFYGEIGQISRIHRRIFQAGEPTSLPQIRHNPVASTHRLFCVTDLTGVNGG